MDSLPTTMSIVGDIICSMINNNMLSKETAPILTEIEKKVISNLAKKFNLGEDSGGVMLAGGSLSNIQAIALARNRILGSFEKGLMGLKRKPYIFASKESHTSIQKAAMVLGLGRNSVVSIETDKNGKMKISNLDKLIKEKIKDSGFPFCIVATAGTTITGSIDNLNEFSKLIISKLKMLDKINNETIKDIKTKKAIFKSLSSILDSVLNKFLSKTFIGLTNLYIS